MVANELNERKKMTEEHAKTAQDIVHIAGDEKHGMEITHDLTKTALMTFNLKYRGRYSVWAEGEEKTIEGEVYSQGGQLMVHTICPRCQKSLRITSDRKNISIDVAKGLIWVEPFQCTWELGERENERMEFGLSLCNTRLAYDGKVAKDA